jgi:hypothetical protein
MSVVIIPGQREPPPADLDPMERESWRAITEALPYDWFRPEALPMLKELCRHVHYSDMLAGMINEALESDAAEDTADGGGRLAELVALLRAHGYQTERIANLSTKLRLTNQSRFSSARAADQHRRRTGGKRPWDDWK